MYESYWNLSGRPFENWDDQRFYYPSDNHHSSLLKLRYAIEHRRSAVALCGDSGMGKSLLIDTLAAQLPEEFTPIARINYSQLCGDQLLGYVIDELTSVTGEQYEPPRTALRRLDQFLAENVKSNQHAVLFVDEAHLLTSPDQLETLRLLLNFQRHQAGAESAWTLVLLGHATLLGMIERNQGLNERISVKCILNRFHYEQTAAYLQHRLSLVGGDSTRIFSPEAIEAIHLRSGGNPRRINRLADLGLMIGYAEELKQIDTTEIEQIYQELVAVAA